MCKTTDHTFREAKCFSVLYYYIFKIFTGW